MGIYKCVHTRTHAIDTYLPTLRQKWEVFILHPLRPTSRNWFGVSLGEYESKPKPKKEVSFSCDKKSVGSKHIDVLLGKCMMNIKLVGGFNPIEKY